MITLGVAVLVAGYVIPARKDKENKDVEQFSREQVKQAVAEEVESAKDQITDIVDETISYAIEKTERSMDRISNEKMMAVSEYSDTVLEQINKNHEEVVFLYDMLNDKHENLKDTVAEASKTEAEVKATIKEVQDFTPVVIDRSDLDDASSEETAESKSKKKTRKSKSDSVIKPVPVIKAVVPPTPTVSLDEADEDETDGFEEEEILEEEWDDFDNDFEDEEMDADGPQISFIARTPGNRNSNERILELHKAGKSNMAIAKELGLGVGEVKLVIDLFKGL